MQNSQIMYVVDNDNYVIKMSGDLRFSLAPSINHALKVISDETQIRDVIIDLNQASSLDSTIIGTLLNFFLKEEIWSRFMANPPRIITRNEDVIKVLLSIGLDMFFPLVNNDSKLKNINKPYIEMKKISEDKHTLEQYVKASHRTLSKLNPRSDFKDIISHIKH